MKHFKLFFAFLLMSVLSIGQVWGDPVVLFHETFGAGSTSSQTWSHSNGSQTGNEAVMADNALTSSATNAKQSKQSDANNYADGAGASLMGNQGSNTAEVKAQYIVGPLVTTNCSDMVVSFAVKYGSVGASYYSNLYYSTDNSNWTSVTLTGGPTTANTWGTKASSSTIPASSKIWFKIEYSLGKKGGNPYIDEFDLSGTYSGGPTNPTVCANPVFDPAASVVASGTSVSITTATAGAAIYYTMGANPADPTSGSTLYEGPISVTSSTTIKAIAIKDGMDDSSVSTAAYTIATPLTTMQDIFSAATTTETSTWITFNSAWVVTGVSSNGKTAYLTDGTKGLILYNKDNSIGLVVGNTLSGTVSRKLLLYSGAAELTGFTTDGLTKSTATLPAVNENAEFIANISGVNTGALISISGAYSEANSKKYIGTGESQMQMYTTLYNCATDKNDNTLEIGSNYACTGVYVQFNNTKEILPRSKNDIVKQVDKQSAETQWVASSKTVRMGDATTSWWSTSSNGAKSFSSSNTAVAEINSTTGVITLKAPGTTTLTFNTTETNEYYSGSATLTLTVKAALPAGGGEVTWDAVAASYTDQAEVTGNVISSDTHVSIELSAGTNSNAPKWYDNGTAVRVYKDNTLTIATKETDKLLYEITINYTSGNTSTYGDVITVNGTIGTWSDVAKSLTLTAPAANRIQSINVVYGDGTETELEIANIAIKTTDEPKTIAVVKNVDATVSYEVDDESVATIADDKITPKAVGTTSVTATIAKGANYTAASTTFTITVAEKQVPTLSFQEASYNANLGTSFTAPTLINASNVSPIKYSSSVPAVATVVEATGAIELVGDGTTVITATFEGDEDFAENSASYTLNVIDPNKDVLTAAGIGKSSYADWSNSFTTAVVYAGNSTTGTSGNAGAIQMRVSSGTQDKSGIVTTTTVGYLKSISGARHTGATTYLDVYAKNTAYESVADLYDADKRGTLIGTINDGAMVFEADKAYADHYKYIGIRSHNNAVYYDNITIAWEPVTFTTYTVTYQAGEGADGEDLVISNIEEGETIQLAEKPNDFAKTDNVFAGWKLNNAGETMLAGDDYTVNANAVFVAQWSESYTVTYKSGEGTGDNVVIENLPSGSYHLAANTFTAPEGKVFIGWKLENVEEDVRAAGSEYTIAGSVAFVAQWITANVVTFVATDDISDQETSITKEGITITSSKFDNNEEGKYYYQCYASSAMTVSSEVGNITNIELTCTAEGTAKYGPGNWEFAGYSYNSYNGSWAGSAETVEFGTAGQQVRMTQIAVTYIPNGNTPKQPAGLSYTQTSYSIAQNEGFTAPTLNNPNNLVVTYSGNNDAVATVNEETGAITLGEATGTVTITAIAAAQGNYNAGTASYTLTVNAPVVIDDLTGTWTLVTDASQLVAGKKVIIASVPDEGAAVTMSTTQATNNRIGLAGATVSEGVITAQNGTAVFTIEAGTEDNTIAFKSSADEYLYAASSGSNYIRSQGTNDANGSWIVTIDEGIATIVAQGEYTHNVMRYNPNTSGDNPLFACYTSSSTTGTLVTLYMLEESTPEPPVVDYTEVRNGLTEGWYYTMCLDKEVTAVKAGSIWKVLSKAANGKDVILEEAELPLVAGRPYIFRAAASTLEVAYTGDAVGAPVNDAANNGLVGSFTEELLDQNSNHYIIYNNALYFVNSDNVYVGAHRAYLNMNGVPNYEPQQGNNARRRVTMAVHGEQVATGMDELNASETPVKVMIDGKFYILRGEKMYDATGKLVK